MNSYIRLPGVSRTLHRKSHPPAVVTNWPRYERQPYLSRHVKMFVEDMPVPASVPSRSVWSSMVRQLLFVLTLLFIFAASALLAGPPAATPPDEVLPFGSPLLTAGQLQWLIGRMVQRQGAQPGVQPQPKDIQGSGPSSPKADSSGNGQGSAAPGLASPQADTASRSADAEKESSTPVDPTPQADMLGIHFTAVDGREVDLASLRGKVVLIDFWATWCGPCMGEIPNVVSAYNKYHEQGFEVIGISFDTSRTALENVTRAKNMPWPQYFDGKGWRNDFGVKFGIHAIPTMWLIDQQGRLVTKNARSNLAAQVEKLLTSAQTDS